jgi:hypothetical protein
MTAGLAAFCGALISTGCSANDPTPPSNQAGQQANAPALPEPGPRVELRLSPIGEERRDRIVIMATATNKSHRPVAWDRFFSVHLHWSVLGENNEAIAWESSAMASRPTPTDSGNRFVVLRPGESFSKEIDLRGPLRVGFEGHGTYRNGGHKGNFYEKLGQYHLSDEYKQITVRLDYFVADHLAYGGLIDWFGEGMREQPFWEGRIESNLLIIPLKQQTAGAPK